MLFEIPTLPDEKITFTDHNKESDITPYSKKLLELRNEIERLTAEDNPIDPELSRLYWRKLKSSINGYHSVVYPYPSRLRYYEILEYLYTKDITPKGCYVFNNNKDRCRDHHSKFQYTDPIPDTKFNVILYRNKKDSKHSHNPDATFLKGNLYHLHHIHKFLNKGGSAIFMVISLDTQHGDVAFPYLLKLFFKQVIVCVTGSCIGLDYNGEHLKEAGFPSIRESSIKPYIAFVKKVKQESIKFHDLLLKPDKTMFYKQFYTNTLQLRLELGVSLSKSEENYHIFILQHLRKNPTNYAIDTASHIYIPQGIIMYNMIVEHKYKKILEIGLCTGMSTAYLLTAAKETGGHVISIDPEQTTKWNNTGLHLIEDMRCKSYHTWINEPSYLAIPVLLSKKNTKSSFDFIFIDAWFTFDTTLIDIILADKLLRVGGIVVIDNYLHNTITTLMDNIIKNWSHYKQIESHRTSIAFKKVAEGIQTYDFKVTF